MTGFDTSDGQVATADRNRVPNGYIDSYDRIRPRDTRELARRLVVSVLAAAGWASGHIKRALLFPRVQILNLHHVFHDEEQPFRDLLRYLMKYSTFISYSGAVERVMSGQIDEPYVALTFDDGLRNCIRAARILAEFNIKACFFVCPDMIGVTDHRKIEEFCTRRLFTPPVEFMDWKDVELLKKEGHEIGGHTMSHPRLSDLPTPELEAEIGGSYEVLARRLGEVRHFAWPFGSFAAFSADAARAVFESGYQSCASAERGCHVAGPSRTATQTCIRRDHTVAKWPLSHIEYFMAKSSRSANGSSRDWPAGWQIGKS